MVNFISNIRNLKSPRFNKYFVTITLLIIAVTLYYLCSTKSIESYGSSRKILFFSSENCIHCKNFQPTWDQFVKTYQANSHIHLRKVNTNKHPELAQKYGINKFPTIVAVDKNKIIAEFNAPRTMRNLIVFLVKVSSMH